MDYSDHRSEIVAEDDFAEWPYVSAPRRTSLSRLERSGVHLSLRDTIGSIPDLRTWRATVARLLSNGSPNILADPRLEALRRFAIIVRLSVARDEDEIDHLLDAGYSLEQAMLVEQIVRARRGQPKAASDRLLPSLLLLLLAVAIFVIVTTMLDEPLLGVIVAGLVAATLASMASSGSRNR